MLHIVQWCHILLAYIVLCKILRMRIKYLLIGLKAEWGENMGPGWDWLCRGLG